MTRIFFILFVAVLWYLMLFGPFLDIFEGFVNHVTDALNHVGAL
jgi:hypothetical protein